MSLREIMKEEYLVISEELEKILTEVKGDLPIKLVREDKEYRIISGYGVFENYWYILIARDSILKDIKESVCSTDTIRYLIDDRKDEMIDEDFFIEDISFLAIENLDDYKIDDYYGASSIKNYSIKNVYIQNQEVVIEIDRY